MPQVSKDVFLKTLKDFDVSLTDHDQHVLVTHYDYDHVNSIYYRELLHNVRFP